MQLSAIGALGFGVLGLTQPTIHFKFKNELSPNAKKLPDRPGIFIADGEINAPNVPLDLTTISKKHLVGWHWRSHETSGQLRRANTWTSMCCIIALLLNVGIPSRNLKYFINLILIAVLCISIAQGLILIKEHKQLKIDGDTPFFDQYIIPGEGMLFLLVSAMFCNAGKA